MSTGIGKKSDFSPLTQKLFIEKAPYFISDFEAWFDPIRHVRNLNRFPFSKRKSIHHIFPHILTQQTAPAGARQKNKTNKMRGTCQRLLSYYSLLFAIIFILYNQLVDNSSRNNHFIYTHRSQAKQLYTIGNWPIPGRWGALNSPSPCANFALDNIMPNCVI